MKSSLKDKQNLKNDSDAEFGQAIYNFEQSWPYRAPDASTAVARHPPAEPVCEPSNFQFEKFRL